MTLVEALTIATLHLSVDGHCSSDDEADEACAKIVTLVELLKQLGEL